MGRSDTCGVENGEENLWACRLYIANLHVSRCRRAPGSSRFFRWMLVTSVRFSPRRHSLVVLSFDEDERRWRGRPRNYAKALILPSIWVASGRYDTSHGWLKRRQTKIPQNRYLFRLLAIAGSAVYLTGNVGVIKRSSTSSLRSNYGWLVGRSVGRSDGRSRARSVGCQWLV